MHPETSEFIERLTLWLTLIGQHRLLSQLPNYTKICETPESLAKAVQARKDGGEVE